jgi:hypothetical protein
VRDGERVRRAETGGTASEEPEEEPEEDPDDEDEDEEDEEARLARSEHARQRPSYIAWHSAPKAQRFGPFRCVQSVLASLLSSAYVSCRAAMQHC